MLGAAQKQAYKYDDSGNIVGFQPYIPYGATVGPGGEITNTAQEQAQAAVAGFSPMQEQAFRQVAGCGFLVNTVLVLCLLVLVVWALQILHNKLLVQGREYNGMATNPFAQQAFMSPYMQNAVDVQKQEAVTRFYEKCCLACKRKLLVKEPLVEVVKLLKRQKPA
jgi:hypothetical protein